jgi:hypothetical protein
MSKEKLMEHKNEMMDYLDNINAYNKFLRKTRKNLPFTLRGHNALSIYFDCVLKPTKLSSIVNKFISLMELVMTFNRENEFVRSQIELLEANGIEININNEVLKEFKEDKKIQEIFDHMLSTKQRIEESRDGFNAILVELDVKLKDMKKSDMKKFYEILYKTNYSQTSFMQVEVNKIEKEIESKNKIIDSM